MRACLAALVLACACKPDPPPPSGGDPVVAITSALLAPDAPGPQVLVTVELPGAGALDVEQQIVIPLEHAITQAVPGIASIESAATTGRARVYIGYESGIDPFTAMSAVRDAIPVTQLPTEASVPGIERADRGGQVMFVLLPPERPGEPVGAEPQAELQRLGDAIAQQAGIWKLRHCGHLRPVLAITLDPTKLVAYGLALDRVVEWIEAKVVDGLGTRTLDEAMAALSSPIDGIVRLTDVAVLRATSRESTCTVTGVSGAIAPTLEVWGTADGIASATKVVHDHALGPRVRTWTVGDPDTPTAIVASSLSPDDERGALLRWLASDTVEPGWLVRDGEDPAWLLAGPGTSLRSFGRAAEQGLHMWWPGAPAQVTARICGPELDVLARTADAFVGTVARDELLDDAVAWAPPPRPRRTFVIDREAAGRHGVSAAEIQRMLPLLHGVEQRISDDVVVTVDTADPSSLGVRGSAGLVRITELGTLRAEAEPAFVFRADRQRCVNVDLQPRRAEDRERIEALVRERIELPPGVIVTIAPA